MVLNSSNSYAFAFDATSKGRQAVSRSSVEGSASYTMTMLYDNTVTRFKSIRLMVRAYAVLKDGSVIYSDVEKASIYEVADNLYQTSSMSTAEAHNYLYDRILSKVNPNYQKVTYRP